MGFLNKKLLFFLIPVLLITATYIILNFSPGNELQEESLQQISTPPSSTQTDKPQVISTKPDPLNESIVSATEVIEITFNRPLENVGEFKVKIEPGKKIKVELSGDRKTAKIIPLEPYDLGAGYTMFIGPESKFDGIGRWGEEKVFHFKTIRYTGV